jgi:uncharacterized membrane protein YhaH (DUF805 family)
MSGESSATVMRRQTGLQAELADVKSQRSRRTYWQVFGMPYILALVSAVGLLAALIGDGWYDAISWITLVVPVVVIAKSIR